MPDGVISDVLLDRQQDQRGRETMLSSRYKQARTLVRRLCRLPGEEKAEFQRKIARLRAHFERFNRDVSDLCQWLMSLRPREGVSDQPVPVFWDFFLEPRVEAIESEEEERDHRRLAVFDQVAGIRSVSELAGQPLPEDLHKAIRQVAERPKTPNAVRLFDRLRGLEPSHRLVLLKAAAEWIVARYQRGVENWKCQREEWEKEKREWETQHPQLTEKVRDAITDIFKNLIENPEGNGSKGLRRKNPRICPYERLRENKDNCVYAGEMGHGPLCWKFVNLAATLKGRSKHFWENAAKYIDERVKLEEPGVELGNKTKHRTALERLFKAVPQCKPWFEEAWKAYLKATGLNEETVIQHGRCRIAKRSAAKPLKNRNANGIRTPICACSTKTRSPNWFRKYLRWNPSTASGAVITSLDRENRRSAILRAGSCRCRKSSVLALTKSIWTTRSCAYG
jgi:hypothetical protein